MKQIFVISLLLLAFTNVYGQEINFGQFYDSNTLSVEKLEDLNFGTIVVGDTKDIELGSNDEGLIRVSGLPFLDVMITVTPILYLFLDGDDTCETASCRIPISMSYFYTNRGEIDFQPGYELTAKPFAIGDMARFQIRERISGPPGPPPTPTITGVALPDPQDAFIYSTGSITNSSSVTPGSYSNTLVFTISYN
jgi:hypothetical protein